MKPSILVVEDDKSLAEALGDTLELADYEVSTAANGVEALNFLERHNVDMVVSDVHMDKMDGHSLLTQLKGRWPEVPVLLMTAYGTIPKAVAAMRQGAVDYLAKPFEADELLARISQTIGLPSSAEGPLAEAPQSRALLQLAQRVAASDATVLINGESGTGKEVIARYLHQQSARKDSPFVAINCAAIPDNMLEATLFGYEKGAFTGAIKTTPGKFEQAQGGTLLLDEISEMDLALQAKLLRVLQEREVERLGGNKLIELDVRVLATTNRDMTEAVAAGRFREDLFYRLNVFPLTVIPLRERPEDILPLAEQFVAQVARAEGRAVPAFTAGVADHLRHYHWPGNVRELENVIRRAMILQSGEQIGEQDLHMESLTTQAPAEPLGSGHGDDHGLTDNLKSQEHRIILEALKLGSRKAAAEKLGISERTLRYKLARLKEQGFSLPS